MVDSINDLVIKQLLNQQKRDRRWKNIRFFIGLIVIICFFFAFFGTVNSILQTPMPTKPYVSLVRLNSMIMPGKPFSAELMQAFSPPAKKRHDETF